MELLERIQQLGDIHGIDYIGIAGIEKFKNELESMGGSKSILRDFPKALSIGIVFPKSIINLLENRNIYENVFQYKHATQVMYDRLDNFASIASTIIQNNGYKVLSIPAAGTVDSDKLCASISHKAVAYLSGFGWIGKNCLLINPDHGPCIRWTTVLTNAPFEENKTILENKCGTCRQCVNACPVQAIKGRNFAEYEPRSARLDVTKCKNYFAELDSLGKLRVCAMCAYACPYGKING